MLHGPPLLWLQAGKKKRGFSDVGGLQQHVQLLRELVLYPLSLPQSTELKGQLEVSVALAVMLLVVQACAFLAACCCRGQLESASLSWLRHWPVKPAHTLFFLVQPN